MTLLLLLLLPPLVGLLLPLLPPGRPGLVRWLAAGAALAQLMVGLLAWRQPPAPLSLEWLPRLGLGLDLGLDGLSLPLLAAAGWQPESVAKPEIAFAGLLNMVYSYPPPANGTAPTPPTWVSGISCMRR